MLMKYIGNGAFCPPYPARDLSDEEVQEFGEKALLETGLYAADKPVKEPLKKTTKEADNGGS